MVAGFCKVKKLSSRDGTEAHGNDNAIGCCDNHHACVVRHLRMHYLNRYPLLALKKLCCYASNATNIYFTSGTLPPSYCSMTTPSAVCKRPLCRSASLTFTNAGLNAALYPT